MGFDIRRFPNGVDEELICTSILNIYFEDLTFVSGAICGGVLQDPLQAPTCEHAFCQVSRILFDEDTISSFLFSGKICINEWLSRVQTCPIDRTPMESDQLKSVPRILKNLLSRLVLIFVERQRT